jgi:hypothetical protein
LAKEFPVLLKRIVPMAFASFPRHLSPSPTFVLHVKPDALAIPVVDIHGASSVATLEILVGTVRSDSCGQRSPWDGELGVPCLFKVHSRRWIDISYDVSFILHLQPTIVARRELREEEYSVFIEVAVGVLVRAQRRCVRNKVGTILEHDDIDPLPIVFMIQA